jgi:hypothetical protein
MIAPHWDSDMREPQAGCSGKAGQAAPEGSSWFWTLAYGYHYDCTPIGYEATREAAMAAFAKSWRRE